MKPTRKALFILGSPNQTSQMFQIYQELKGDFEGYFTQFFPHSALEKFAVRIGLLENTIIDGRFKKKSEDFVREHNLNYDYGGAAHMGQYDIVFMCTDAIYPEVARRSKSIFIQEGMVDPLDTWSKWVKKMGLPAYFTGTTSLNGSMNGPDVYCVASEGYKERFASLGTDPGKIAVTGIPNFDNCNAFLNNSFPYKDYVLVCTTDMRETFRRENRPEFIRQCVKIAAGRPMIFKLHPNEIWDRAYREITSMCPENTLVFQSGDTNHMIANCAELITQYSTVVYVGLALGKPVHSYFELEELKRLQPIQTGGKSAAQIADLARHFADFNGSGPEFLQQYRPKLLSEETL